MLARLSPLCQCYHLARQIREERVPAMSGNQPGDETGDGRNGAPPPDLSSHGPPDVTADGPRLGPGVYGVVFEIDRQVSVATGKLGQLVYPAGGYLYIGSAMGGISGRVRRYLDTPKRTFWHIDYLLPRGRAVAIVAGESDRRVECDLARDIGRQFTVVKRFGSSDCQCAGHLFHGGAARPLTDALVAALRAVGCRPRFVLDRSASS